MESFFTAREMTRPMTSGKFKKDYTFEDYRAMTAELTAEEAKQPFAEFYDEPMAPLQPHMLAALETPLRPQQCMPPQESGPLLLTQDKTYPDCGYGVMENGVGYASSYFHFDGITDEMIAYYREHFAHTEDTPNLFYKVWFPGYHLIHLEDGIVENWGWGFCLQDMNWELLRMKPHLGVDRDEILKLDPDCIAFVGVGGGCREIDHPEKETQTMMTQYTRQTATGRDLWVHYWYGMEFKPDGSIVVCPTEDHDTMEAHMKMVMRHSMMEYCNEFKHMKDFWNARQEEV